MENTNENIRNKLRGANQKFDMNIQAQEYSTQMNRPEQPEEPQHADGILFPNFLKLVYHRYSRP